MDRTSGSRTMRLAKLLKRFPSASILAMHSGYGRVSRPASVVSVPGGADTSVWPICGVKDVRGEPCCKAVWHRRAVIRCTEDTSCQYLHEAVG